MKIKKKLIGSSKVVHVSTLLNCFISIVLFYLSKILLKELFFIYEKINAAEASCSLTLIVQLLLFIARCEKGQTLFLCVVGISFF